MNEAILTVVMVLYSVFDQRGDATNEGKYKRPNSHLPWPFVDVWHTWKHLRFYLPPVYILTLTLWPSLLPQWWGFAIATPLAYCAWKILPTPEHWRKS